MSVVSTDGDQSDYGFQRIVHGEGAGAVQTSETRSEEIQTGQMISSHWVAEINAAIVSDIQEGKKAYMETLASGGSKAQAEKPPMLLLVAGSPHYMTSYVKTTSR